MKRIHMRINELMKEHGVSKNRVCKDLDIPRPNFNRYCRNEFQRIDTKLIINLCEYFKCNVEDLIVIVEEEEG